MLYKQFMKTSIQKFKHFLMTPAGIVILFVLVFYILTFTVYWFYSPGPEERRTAQISAQEGANTQSTAGQSATATQNNLATRTANP